MKKVTEIGGIFFKGRPRPWFVGKLDNASEF